MAGLRLDRLLDLFTGLGFFLGTLWVALCVLTVALVILTFTRWGQSRPVRKCMVFSLLLHFWLACYSTTLHPSGLVVPASRPQDTVVDIASLDSMEQEKPSTEPALERQPWEKLAEEEAPPPELPEPDRQKTAPRAPPERTPQKPSEIPGQASVDHLPLERAPSAEPPRPQPAEPPKTEADQPAEKIDVPAPQQRAAQAPLVPVGPRLARVEKPGPTALAMRPSAAIPSALLESTGELPRVSASAEATEPVGLLAGQSDPTPTPTRDAAAALEPSRGDPAYAAAPAQTPAGRMWTPSLAAVASRREFPALPEPLSAGKLAPPRLTPEPADITRDVPDAYRLRVAPDRAALAERHGGTGRTEAAVKAALAWLTAAQAADGRWGAGQHGGGRELRTDGQTRQGAGTEADTGVTGLALLAFLASGHTHREGAYRENVYRGLRYLLESQAANGSLGGRATTFEFMYCHAMATFAMSEAWGMSGDEALREPLRRALEYTIAAQSPATGGWRYWPGDPGDTSQLGWQFMALKSAELAGIPMPETSRNGIIKFLGSVAGGDHGGLASYRPNERLTRTMTAEAIVCWQLLGMPREHPAGREAGDFLLGELPGHATPNVYYWYYATLAMYQLGGTHWTRWNDALRSTLVSTQRPDGPLAGSWDPDPVWGGYGGRVYSTSLSALCLEVYYRFLPLYRQAAVEEQAR